MNRMNRSKSGFTLIELLVWIAIVAILISMFGGCGINGVNSNGERTGVISKFSYKEGVIAKSWEGEMVLGGIRGSGDGMVGANVWQFTVPDDSALIAKAKFAAENGIRVTIHYHQPFFYNTFNTRSGYYVKDITIAPTNIAKENNPFL